ncbi:MAG: hypothetical protein AAB619_01610 [Patescibacteria group bacterium]
MDEQDQLPITTADDSADQPKPQAIDAAEVLPLLETAQRALDTIRQMLVTRGIQITPLAARLRPPTMPTGIDQEGAKIIEGAFDGQNMLGPDGKQYSVPANYASKSKLVEGDVLKLTITRDGSFIYKQIGPIERQRLIGQLTRDDITGEYRVVADGRNFKVLLASITYFKGEPGDEVVVLVPASGESRWAAVENIIKQSETDKGLV